MKLVIYDNYHISVNDYQTKVVVEQDIVWVNSIKGDKGDKGDKGEQGIQGIQGIAGINGQDGISAYQSYLNTTTDNPPLTEAEWSESFDINNLQLQQATLPLTTEPILVLQNGVWKKTNLYNINKRFESSFSAQISVANSAYYFTRNSYNYAELLLTTTGSTSDDFCGYYYYTFYAEKKTTIIKILLITGFLGLAQNASYIVKIGLIKSNRTSGSFVHTNKEHILLQNVEFKNHNIIDLTPLLITNVIEQGKYLHEGYKLTDGLAHNINGKLIIIYDERD